MKPFSNSDSNAAQVENIIKKFNDWRGKELARIRNLIKEADPEVLEEVKWKKPTNPDGIPVWSDNGLICTGEVYKNHIRLTFAKGEILKNSSNLFNTYRAIVIKEENIIDETAFKELVKAAVELNRREKL